MRKKLVPILLIAALLSLIAISFANADTFGQVLDRWTKSRKYIGEDKLSNLEIKATYYSAEFIEAYIQKEAEANLWTQQEADDYKYKFLSALKLDEMIPIQIEINNNAETMYMGPFDIMAKLTIKNKAYKPVDYDKRLNFKFQGKKEGLVYFPRYDEKTGKDLLEGVKTVTQGTPQCHRTNNYKGTAYKISLGCIQRRPAKALPGKDRRTCRDRPSAETFRETA